MFYRFFTILILTIGVFHPLSAVVLTLDGSIERLLTCNREVREIQDNLVRANMNLDNEWGCFSWRASPDAIFGLTNCQEKDKNGDLTYGSGLGLAKKFTYGQRLYVHPSIQKKGKGYQSQLTASFTQPLLRGFGRGYNMSRICSSQFALRNTVRQAYQKNVDLMQKTIQGLYGLIKQKEIVRLNRESYQRLRKFYEGSRLKERVGIATAMDVYRAELEVKNAEERLNSSIDQLKDAEDQMREMLGYDQAEELEVDIPLDQFTPDLSEEEAKKTAWDNRIEVDLAKDALHEAKRLCHVSKNDLWPELNLVLDYTNSYCYDRFMDIINWDRKDYWKVGFSTSQELNSAADRSQYVLSRLAVDQAKRHIDKVCDLIALEVRRSLRGVERSKKQIEIQEKQVLTSQGSLRLASLKFEKGMASNFDVIQAEKNLHQAQIQLFTSIIDTITNQVKLTVSLGLFAEKPNIGY